MELQFRHKGGNMFGNAKGSMAKKFFGYLTDNPEAFRFGSQKMVADNTQGFEEFPCFFSTDHTMLGWGDRGNTLEVWFAPTDYVLVKK